MNRELTAIYRLNWPRTIQFVAAVALGSMLAVSRSPLAVLLAVVAVMAYGVFAVESVSKPGTFIAALLVVLETLPPLYFSRTGDRPIFVSFFLVPIAFAVLLCRWPDLRFEWGPVGRGLLAYVSGIGLSVPFAWLFSGSEVGMESLTRWLLLSQVVLVYVLIRADRDQPSDDREIFRLLLVAAVVSAAYGIVDFIWPVPLEHPAADQFIWLASSVLRRAQGVFYESSNFANFCEFFVVAAAAAFLGRRERYLKTPRYLLILFISILTLAVLVAFSRTVWISLIVALLTCMVLSGFIRLRRATIVLAASVIPLYLLWIASPELWDYLVQSRVARLADIFTDPNVATSGRFDTWTHVLSLIRENPQYLIFGVGYKTLPLTRLFQGEIVTDNGYLSLLLETGVVGLTGFCVWSWSILKTFLRLTRSKNDTTVFWATVLISIWCGELVLLLASDAHTYWRNLAVLAAMMAFTMNFAERQTALRSGG